MLVIGNGESRKFIDLNNILLDKIGCNAIYRDYPSIKHLVCVDKRMVKEVIDAGYNQTGFIYTRGDWFPRFKQYKRVRTVPDLPYAGSERKDEPFHWGSGPYAVLLGAKKSNVVHMTGFDLYSNDNKVNNIYKDTDNYITSDKRAVNPSYWIHQIGMVFKHFSNTNFVVYQEDGWKLPTEWKYSNVTLDNISNIYYNT